MAPGIGTAATQRLENFPSGMIAPDRAAHWNAPFGRRAGRADLAGTRGSAAAIKPAIRAKMQPISEVMVVFRRHCEPIEDHFGCAVRHIVGVTIRNENKPRPTHQPDHANTHLTTG